ncbi:hypothetical protein [Listeria kieliensis]
MDAEGSRWGRIAAEIFTPSAEKMKELESYIEECPRQVWNEKDEQLVEEMKSKIEALLK